MHLPKCISALVSENTFGSERVDDSQKPLKSGETYFYPSFSSFWAKLRQKNWFFIRYEILGLLVHTLTANYEYSGRNRENLPLAIPMQLSIQRKTFAVFFSFCCIFWIYVKLNCFEKKMSLIGQVFLKLLTPKDILTKCITGLLSVNPLGVNVLKSSENCWNLQKKYFFPTF